MSGSDVAHLLCLLSVKIAWVWIPKNIKKKTLMITASEIGPAVHKPLGLS